jgi:hypothetical protein
MATGVLERTPAGDQVREGRDLLIHDQELLTRFPEIAKNPHQLLSE